VPEAMPNVLRDVNAWVDQNVPLLEDTGGSTFQVILMVP
jgi:hypothetical protein